MSIEVHAQRKLAEQILRAHGYRCGTVPVIHGARTLADEFVVIVRAGDPVFTWDLRNGAQCPADRFPVGFVHVRLRNGEYVLMTAEDETPVDLAERISALVSSDLSQQTHDSGALSALSQ